MRVLNRWVSQLDARAPQQFLVLSVVLSMLSEGTALGQSSLAASTYHAPGCPLLSTGTSGAIEFVERNVAVSRGLPPHDDCLQGYRGTKVFVFVGRKLSIASAAVRLYHAAGCPLLSVGNQGAIEFIDRSAAVAQALEPHQDCLESYRGSKVFVFANRNQSPYSTSTQASSPPSRADTSPVVSSVTAPAARTQLMPNPAYTQALAELAAARAALNTLLLEQALRPPSNAWSGAAAGMSKGLAEIRVRNAERKLSETPVYLQVPVATSSPQREIAPDGARVRLVASGGTFTVPVRVNGVLTLNFTVDSGASDVSIPADVVLTLYRTGTLRDDDFIGEQQYQLADGSIVKSRTFRIRSLQLGSHTLSNVLGSAADIKGSLLLGQSFLSRFRSWSIDNATQELVLVPQ